MTAPNPRIPTHTAMPQKSGRSAVAGLATMRTRPAVAPMTVAMATLVAAAMSAPAAKNSAQVMNAAGATKVEVRGKSKTVAEVAVIEPVEAEVERDLDPGEREHAERDSQRDCLLEFVDHRLSFSVVVTRGERSRPGGVCW